MLAIMREMLLEGKTPTLSPLNAQSALPISRHFHELFFTEKWQIIEKEQVLNIVI